MAKDWRCLIGRHDRRVVETDNRDKYAECTRCGKHDWTRLVKWSGGGDVNNLPPGGTRPTRSSARSCRCPGVRSCR